MPIKIDSHLSAKEKLREENIITIDNDRALTQDIRPLKILILNLMPLKKPTEVQLLRLLGNSPLQLEIDFCRPVSRVGTHTDNSYLESAYLEFRWAHRHRGSCGKTGIRGCGILGRNRGIPGMGPDPCVFRAPLLLGCPGRPVLLL